MATFRLEIVTAERLVFADDVNAVVAWGVEGQLGIFPNHAPLMTMLRPLSLSANVTQLSTKVLWCVITNFVV